MARWERAHLLREVDGVGKLEDGDAGLFWDDAQAVRNFRGSCAGGGLDHFEIAGWTGGCVCGRAGKSGDVFVGSAEVARGI